MKKSIKPVIHIFHNGAVAEVNYFQDFKDFLAAQDAWVNISNNWKRTKGKAPWQVIDFAIKSKFQRKMQISAGAFLILMIFSSKILQNLRNL
jgi:hypothetical protein